MKLLSMPSNHVTRYNNFSIDGILDETLREGSERCLFSISTEHKIPLIKKIISTGIREIIFGSGPKDPTDLSEVIERLLNDTSLPSEIKFSEIGKNKILDFEKLIKDIDQFYNTGTFQADTLARFVREHCLQ